MDKTVSQLQLYQYFLGFFLPKGILDFFEPVWMETQSLDSRESKKDILYTGTLHMYLDERDNRTDEMQDLRPNGFTYETVISDFPARDKKLTLHIRRRRWLTQRGKASRLVQDRQPMHYTRGQVGKGCQQVQGGKRLELLHRSLNECFSRVTQLQDESLPCSASRCIRSTILHVQAMQALRIVSHGTLQVSRENVFLAVLQWFQFYDIAFSFSPFSPACPPGGQPSRMNGSCLHYDPTLRLLLLSDGKRTRPLCPPPPPGRFSGPGTLFSCVPSYGPINCSPDDRRPPAASPPGKPGPPR